VNKFRTGVAALAAAALVAAGCGSDDNSKTTASAAKAGDTTMSTMAHASTTTSGKGGVDSGSSALRSALTAGLQEHVYLAGIAVENGVTNGLDSAEFKAAAGTLDKNSVALSQAIEGVYGGDAGAAFLKIWRQHIGFFVDYTKGRATKNDAMVAKANKDLDGYRAQFGAFLAKANPNLTADAVANDLKGHVATLEAAIDAVVAKKANAFDLLQAAAAHMPGTADVLSSAISKQFPKKFSGSSTSGASVLRANMTAGLQEHVYLAGIAVAEGVGHGLDSAQFKAAAGTLDNNTVALSKMIGSVYGDSAEQAFLKVWRQHIGFFVDYTKARATKDAAGVKKANADLDGYRAQFGAFLAKANPNLTQTAVANDLKGHVATLEAAIDAVVAKQTNAFDLLQAAAAHMPGTADVLSGAIQKQFPKKFPA
jgi:cytochrome c556